MTTMNWQQPGDPAWLFEVLKLDGLKGGLEAACGNAGGNYYSDEYGGTCFGEDGGYIECGWGSAQCGGETPTRANRLDSILASPPVGGRTMAPPANNGPPPSLSGPSTSGPLSPAAPATDKCQVNPNCG